MSVTQFQKEQRKLNLINRLKYSNKWTYFLSKTINNNQFIEIQKNLEDFLKLSDECDFLLLSLKKK